MTKRMTIEREQAIDAVALVRRIRDAQAEQIQGMTAVDRITVNPHIFGGKPLVRKTSGGGTRSGHV
jgi:hypothetical protein